MEAPYDFTSLIQNLDGN